MGLYGLEWGAGMEKPECVRVPVLLTEMRFPGWIRVFPRLPDGGLEVTMGLEVRTTEGLRADEAWGRFAE